MVKIQKKVVMGGIVAVFAIVAIAFFLVGGEVTGAATTQINSMKEYNDCLAENGMVIYGSQSCPHCVNLVNLLGGYDAVESVYVECSKNQQRCSTEMIGRGVPEIQINGEMHKGQRTLESFSQATGCSLPSVAK